MGRPVSNAEPKERMTFYIASDLAYKLRALAFEQKKPHSAVFNDLVRPLPTPVLEPNARSGAEEPAAKYSRADQSNVDKERVTLWMEPGLAYKVRAMAFAQHVPHSKIATDLLEKAPTPSPQMTTS
ncbi:hypothetical protein [Pseudomonas sp. MPR-ANC1]|uniref:hypothetical protein n=1 Tax=Pseudomonas sp. MPR-ANC1 TaxID=2075548 RepID=UPI0011AF36C6|nr:hypothetical protein [Pseudomonas sp. MPR-ANC1]